MTKEQYIEVQQTKNYDIVSKLLYYMSKKYWLILYSKLLHKKSHYFLDTQYLSRSALAKRIREYPILKRKT